MPSCSTVAPVSRLAPHAAPAGRSACGRERRVRLLIAVALATGATPPAALDLPAGGADPIHRVVQAPTLPTAWGSIEPAPGAPAEPTGTRPAMQGGGAAPASALPAEPAAPAPEAGGPPSPALPHRPEPMRGDAVAAALSTIVEHSLRAVRSYAQIGLAIRVPAATLALADAVRTVDRQFVLLAGGGGRHMPPARVRALSIRWRTLRDATGTRPAPQIAALMDEVAEQMIALTTGYAAQLAPAPRPQRLRILLQALTVDYLLACWAARPASASAMLAHRITFGYLLANVAEGRGTADPIGVATLHSQWGLFAGGLDGVAGRCDAVSMNQVASTGDRLAEMLGAAANPSVAAGYR